MKIDEVIDLYNFLATCGWPGILGLWFSMSLILGTAAVLAKAKLELSTRTLRWLVIIIIPIIVGVVIRFFKKEADVRKDILEKANCVKSEFVTYGWKVASYSTMLDSSFHCPCVKRDLENILKGHPSEFIEVKMDDGINWGIRIIDGNALAAINNYNHEHNPFIKSRIQDYMDSHHIDSLSYAEIREKINEDFDDEWIEIMLSKYDSIFTPSNTQEEKVVYGKNHFVKRKREGVKKK